MEEGVTYADLRLPPTPAPQQLVRLRWYWAAFSLAFLSLLLLLAQIILVGLNFHYLRQQVSCTHSWSMKENSSYGQQTLRGQCQFCPTGWLWDAGRCYYFSSAKKSWEQSREDCCSRGAQLVTIRTNATLAFLVRTVNMEVFHMGLKQDGSRTDWKWLDGTALKGRDLGVLCDRQAWELHVKQTGAFPNPALHLFFPGLWQSVKLGALRRSVQGSPQLGL